MTHNLKDADACARRFAKLSLARKRARGAVSNTSFKISKLSLTERKCARKPVTAVKRNDRVCRICYLDLGRNDFTQLPCQHFYHTTCVIAWFKKAAVTVCPTCKKCVKQTDTAKHAMKVLVEQWARKLNLQITAGHMTPSEVDRFLTWLKGTDYRAIDRTYAPLRVLALSQHDTLRPLLDSVNGSFRCD